MKINMKVNKIRINKMNKIKSLCFLNINQADDPFERLIKNKKENGKKSGTIKNRVRKNRGSKY